MATIEELYRRLDKGFDQMGALEREGKPVPDKWLETWLRLLGEYERQVREARRRNNG